MAGSNQSRPDRSGSPSEFRNAGPCGVFPLRSPFRAPSAIAFSGTWRVFPGFVLCRVIIFQVMARRKGSTVTGWVCGAALALFGLGILLGWISSDTLMSHRDWINGASCLIFGGILCYWALSTDGKPKVEIWGIGNETVTMVVTVITGVVTIFTLLKITDKVTQ